MKTEKNKVALVTGANTGVGFQIAKALAENNYTVYIGARNLEKGKNAASQLGKNAIAIELDVTKQTVGKWRKRFQERRLDGRSSHPRPWRRRWGRPG